MVCYFEEGGMVLLRYFVYLIIFQGLDTFGLMYYNNLISLPLVVLVCLINGDFRAVLRFPFLYNSDFWV